MSILHVNLNGLVVPITLNAFYIAGDDFELFVLLLTPPGCWAVYKCHCAQFMQFMF